MPLTHARRIAGAATIALLALGGISGTRAAEPPAIEPRAAEILKAALTHLSGAGSFALRAEMTDEATLPSGEKLHYPSLLEITVRRPDRLRYTIDGERRRVRGWYDGKAFTLLDDEQNVCATAPAAGGLSALFDGLKERYGFRPPLAMLLREDAPEAAMKGLTSGFYVGQGRIGGDLCHHLAFRQENVDVQLWIAAEGVPVIRRVILTRKKLPAAPQLAFTFLDWDFKAAPGDAHFVFVPPQGAVWCEFQKLGTPGPGRE